MTNNQTPAPLNQSSHLVLLMSESQERTTFIAARLQDSECAYESVNLPAKMVTRAEYNHYDAIVVDLDCRRAEVIESVATLRQLEASRGQPPTPIIGISSSDDALADLDAIDQGCDDVLRCGPADVQITRAVGRAVRGTLQTA